MAGYSDQPLPPLRDDLRLSEASDGSDGEPAWVIQDTVINRFYRIGWLEFECLLRWHLSPRQMCEQISEHTALHPDVQQILELRRFLEQHQLLRGDLQALSRPQADDGKNNLLSGTWWLHHYLFFRIPLLHPQRHLQGLARALRGVFHPLTAALISVLTLLGIILVLHQWDTFSHDVVESFSTEGLFSFALALIVAKTLHELGHALVATRLGLKVSHMGIAFVVLWPMLYTDTGESWKLRRPRQRLAIASAGIVTELSLAGLSTLGWALCDPGAVRNALLYLATTSWVLSLALNASPFMRFDGYFILCDLLDFPNLHERASAVARVALRRWLLGLSQAWPEAFSPRRRRWLIAFAISTWCYRLVLFLGIAYAVYLFFFKLLGIVLFSVELCWFIAMPVMRELKHWWLHRNDVTGHRRVFLGAAVAITLMLLALPWRTQIDAYGVAHAERQLRVYAPYPSRLQSIRPVGQIHAGDTLVTLDEPDMTSRAFSSAANARSYEARLTGLIADPAGFAEAIATLKRLNVQYEAARSARDEIARLTIKASFSGFWTDINPDWHPGQWVDTREPLGIVIDPSSWQVDAYVAQDKVQRLAVGDPVRFYPEGRPEPVSGTLLAIGSARASRLSHRMLSSHFGGPLSTSTQDNGVAPTSALFQVLVQLEAAPEGNRETRGHLKISGERRSLLAQGATQLMAVLMRESGF